MVMHLLWNSEHVSVAFQILRGKKRFKIISRFKKSEDHGPETTQGEYQNEPQKIEMGVELKIDVGSREIIFSSL